MSVLKSALFASAVAVAIVSSAGAYAAHAGHEPAPVVPLASQPPARLIADAPLAAQLARGLVVIQYRSENLRIVPVYGAAASGEPLIIQGLTPGRHRVLIELADPAHKVIDSQTVEFEIPQRAAHH
jgi:hypothetical protein